MSDEVRMETRWRATKFVPAAIRVVLDEVMTAIRAGNDSEIVEVSIRAERTHPADPNDPLGHGWEIVIDGVAEYAYTDDELLQSGKIKRSDYIARQSERELGNDE